jgi:hypothetical protein
MNSEDYQFLNNLENIHTLPRENIQQIITIYDNQIGTRSRPQIQTSIRDRVLPLIMRIHQQQQQQQQLQQQQQQQQQLQQADSEQLKDKRNRHSEDEPPPKRGKHNPLQPELSRVLGGKRSSKRNRRTKKMQKSKAGKCKKTKRQREKANTKAKERAKANAKMNMLNESYIYSKNVHKHNALN